VCDLDLDVYDEALAVLVEEQSDGDGLDQDDDVWR